MNTKIILSATWLVVELIYLYGDVLRVYHSGDTVRGLADMKLNEPIWLGIAFLMLTANPGGFPELGIAPVCESLGEYHRGRLLFSVQPGWVASLSTII